MAQKHFIKILSVGLAGLILFPSVNNPTPAGATDDLTFNTNSADSIWVVVNKQRPLSPATYKPASLVKVDQAGLNLNPYDKKLRKIAASALVKLAKAMKAQGGGRLILQSGYRSYDEQSVIHDRMVKKYGLADGEAVAARPGYSEHQTGLAADVSARNQGCQIRVCFGQTKAGRWLAKNAYKYGFIVRYPDNSHAITGYQYEPWHLRFVGINLATSMKQKHIHTLEQYFKLPSAPKYR
ncbi:MAG: hypothetical protein RIQ88_268 [Actinomycetota bacterium]